MSSSWLHWGHEEGPISQRAILVPFLVPMPEWRYGGDFLSGKFHQHPMAASATVHWGSVGLLMPIQVLPCAFPLNYSPFRSGIY